MSSTWLGARRSALQQLPTGDQGAPCIIWGLDGKFSKQEIGTRVTVTARLASEKDVDSIVRICSDGWRATYAPLLSGSAIEDVISRYYNPTRVADEIKPDPPGWLGWIIASDEDGVVGAVGAGGLTTENTGEVFVLYADVELRYSGFGSAVLRFMTDQQEKLGATEQWVSVAKGNELGLPFYRSRGFSYVTDVQSWDGTGSDEGFINVRMKRSLPR